MAVKCTISDPPSGGLGGPREEAGETWDKGVRRNGKIRLCLQSKVGFGIGCKELQCQLLESTVGSGGSRKLGRGGAQRGGGAP